MNLKKQEVMEIMLNRLAQELATKYQIGNQVKIMASPETIELIIDSAETKEINNFLHDLFNQLFPNKINIKKIIFSLKKADDSGRFEYILENNNPSLSLVSLLGMFNLSLNREEALRLLAQAPKNSDRNLIIAFYPKCPDEANQVFFYTHTIRACVLEKNNLK